jgi:glutaredoxin 3
MQDSQNLQNPEVIMYATRICPYCNMALALLKKKGIDITTITKILVDEKPELREQMMELTGRKTVPQIFINGQYVGGCDDLHALENEGKLDQLINNKPNV